MFGALLVPDDVCEVDHARCVGCGVCISACPTDALSMERRPEDEIAPVPTTLQDWMAQRAEERGIPISDIL